MGELKGNGDQILHFPFLALLNCYCDKNVFNTSTAAHFSPHWPIISQCSHIKHFDYLQYVELSSSSMYGWLECVLTKCVHLLVYIVTKRT